MTQTREKWDCHALSRRDFWMVWRCHGIPCVIIFLFRTNGKKGYLDENDFHTVIVVFPKVSFWKLLDLSYVQSCLSTIMRHIDTSIMKDTLQLKILRTRIKIRSNSFIKTWVNMMKRKPRKMHGKLQIVQKLEPVLQRTLFTFWLLLFNGSWNSFSASTSFL